MATIIEKENVAQLNFLPAEEDNSKKWRSELDYAVRLGNAYKGKTSVTFVSKEGIFEVHTTIWAVTESELSLKRGYSYTVKEYNGYSFLIRPPGDTGKK